MDDATRLRTLIERWARAVHAGDLDGVLVDHAADIVMFDVPHQRKACGGWRPIAPPGRRSSSGRAKAPASRV
jgi:ketosteroid isomerase-like protein